MYITWSEGFKECKVADKDMMSSLKYFCPRGCCHFFVRPYLHRLPPNHLRTHSVGLRKAGSFVYDLEQHKILLVQSRGQMWGPPKGSIHPGESPLECARREVMEETGLELEITPMTRTTIVKCKALFVLTEMKECPVELQTDQNDNDANGIGWFSIDCLNDMVEEGLISINQPCRLLIRRVFGREVAYNVDSFIPVRRSFSSHHHRIAHKEEKNESNENE